MFTDTIIIACALAGGAVVWRNLLHDLPRLRPFLFRTLPYIIAKPLTCGFCSTLWATLGLLFFIDPLHGWSPLFLVPFPDPISRTIGFFLRWMALGYLAVTLRFFFAALQETVYYQVHTLGGPDHPHVRGHSLSPTNDKQ